MSGGLAEEEGLTPLPCARSKRRGMNREKRDYLPWAPKEDKVLLDLLVEQVHKGRKQDKLFTREAWDEVVPQFNKVARANKTKSNMTNRMKTWRKTYRVISEMIEYGFVWDESNKMIAASDVVWEAYIKGNPEAKIYRYRPILNYKKLGLVVANTGDDLSKLDDDDDDPEEKTTSTQSLDSCSPDVDMEETLSEKPPFVECSLNEGTQLADMLVDPMQHEDDETSIIPIESKWNEVLPCFDSSNNMLEGAKSGEPSDLLWSTTDDKLLLSLLAEEVGKVGKKENELTKEMWAEITSKFNVMVDISKTKEDLIGRVNIWRKLYGIFRAMIEEDGFLWDDSIKIVIAEDAVWDGYIKVHPEAHSFRGKTFSNYNALEVIFSHPDTSTVYFPAMQTADGCAMTSSSPNRSPYAFWSSREDKFLLDLFVDQVHRGMKRENMFAKEAWKEVVQKFNETMRTNKTREHMLNRMKTWKRTYNAVLSLISQDGFFWDNSLKMIVADDKVWDEYIKAHPEAKSYRNKVIANYDCLAIVLGDSDAINSLILTTNASNSSELRETSIEHARNEHAKESLSRSKKSKAVYLPWPPSEDKLLLELLVEQVYKGEKKDNVFSRDAWNEVVAKFNEVTSSKKTRDHMLNRMKTWRRTYSIVSAMIEENEFIWDESKNMVVAGDAVWDNYLKDHPEARYLRFKSISNYKHLAMVVGNKAPDGSQTTHVNCLDEAGRGVQILGGFELENVAESSSFTGEEPRCACLKGSKRRRSGTLPPSHSQPEAQQSTESMSGLVDIVNAVAFAFAKLHEKKEPKDKDDLVDGWYDALTAVPDLDEDLFLEATILLQEREKAKIFTRLDPKLRRKWLFMMLRRHQT